jgi:hypothetical protein
MEEPPPKHLAHLSDLGATKKDPRVRPQEASQVN